ncbi:MAG TPA: hypothetical protein VIK89_03925, partial [Cytophagaceae bacterium]
MIKLRAFRAIDDKETCEKFIEGHVKVLIDYGITNITTNKPDWMTNPAIYGVVAEMEDDNRIVGGIRVHIANNQYLLPVEEAIGKLDPNIHSLVRMFAQEGVGELCALWNAKEVAGRGVSVLLLRAGISIINQINLNSLLTICSDYTMPMVSKVGFVIERNLGNNGEFVYPNSNYIARVLRKLNAVTLETAHEYDRGRILDLRQNPVQERMESGPKGEFLVKYNLIIPPKS